MPSRPPESTVIQLVPPLTRVRRDAGGDPAAMSLTLLGGFAVRVDGAEVEFPTALQRMVAVLALRGRLSRSRLAGTLWPETTEHRALARLRTGIWRINNIAAGLVASTNSTVDVGGGVDVDVHRLVGDSLCVMRAGPAAPAGDASAVLDGEGDLLPDWEDEWLLADRERLRQLRLHVLEVVAGQLAAAGNFGLAMEAALAALRMDALRESAHRAIIGIHLAEGNVNDARRAYDRCRLIMVRDVGVEPSQATSCLLPLAFDGPTYVIGR
jgi:DNA-binding SARP family transcriptional activator